MSISAVIVKSVLMPILHEFLYRNACGMLPTFKTSYLWLCRILNIDLNTKRNNAQALYLSHLNIGTALIQERT